MTGIYDTRKYTAEAWMLFDMLIDKLVPVGPTYADGEATLLGYVQSGLKSYIDHLSGRETADTVRRTAWNFVFAYRLGSMLHFIDGELRLKNPNFGLIPTIPPLVLFHPAYDADYPELLWFLGEQRLPANGWTPDSEPGHAEEYYTPRHVERVRGVDLGMSVNLGWKTLVYMGDTWGNRGATGCANPLGSAVAWGN